MSNEMFGIRDEVSISSESGVWTIIGTRAEEPKFQVQLGRDAATVRFIPSEALKMVKKHLSPDEGSRFVPERSIMG